MPIMCAECGEESAPGFALEVEEEQPPVERREEKYEDDVEDFDEDFYEDSDEDMDNEDLS